jgi:hypothetical protein
MDPPYKNPPHLFTESMAKPLLDEARKVMRESKVDTFEEFISSDALLRKVGREFEKYSYGWPLKKMPARSPREIRCELIRLNEKWKSLTWKNERDRERDYNFPWLWTVESEDDDDIFEPSSKAKKAASSKGKSAKSSKGKSAAPPVIDSDDDFEPSTKAKKAASSKGKSDKSSKGKSAAPPVVDSDDDFEPSIKATKAAASKGKGKGVLRS